MFDIMALFAAFTLCVALTVYKIWFEKDQKTIKEDRKYIDQDGKLITLTVIKIK